MAVFAPCRIHVGPIRFSFHGVRNPMLELLAGYALWRATYDGFGRWLKNRVDRIENVYGEQARRCGIRLLALWRRWGWRQRAMLLLLASQGVCVAQFWQSYPGLLDYERQAEANESVLAEFGPAGAKMPTLAHFCRQVCEGTPPGTRILFHGATPAMRFAYEVYPRRVFMLPQEMTAMAESWHVQPQLRDLAPDPHEPYWHQFLPHEVADPQAFIREHGINFIATFDEFDLSRCRVEPAP